MQTEGSLGVDQNYRRPGSPNGHARCHFDDTGRMVSLLETLRRGRHTHVSNSLFHSSRGPAHATVKETAGDGRDKRGKGRDICMRAPHRGSSFSDFLAVPQSTFRYLQRSRRI